MSTGQVMMIQSSENIQREVLNQQGWTNDVLVCKKTHEKELFLPCYLKTKLKNIVSLDTQANKGTINISILLYVHYGLIEKVLPEIIDKIRQNVVLRFKIDPPMKLTKGYTKFEDAEGNKRSHYVEVEINQDQKVISFNIRRTLIVPLTSHLFWSPFQYIKYVSTISVDSMNIEASDQIYRVSFNFMDIKSDVEKQTVISFTQQGTLGEYNLARSKVNAEFTNNRHYSKDNQMQLKSKKNKKQKKFNNTQHQFDDEGSKLKSGGQKIESFKFAHIIYPTYRHPIVPYVNLFLPIVMLGFLNLGIFFQDPLSSGKKVINIGFLLVSYFYFLPTIRQKLPPTKTLVISQILLFSMASLTIICLAHTIKYRNAVGYYVIWNQDPIYIATLVLTIVIVSILFIIWLTFFIRYYRKYNKKNKSIQRPFDRHQWINKGCDQYFNDLNQKGIEVKKLSQQSVNYYQSTLRKQKSQEEDNFFSLGYYKRKVSQFI